MRRSRCWLSVKQTAGNNKHNAKIISSTRYQSTQTESKPVTFNYSYNFKIFEEDYDKLKPVEIFKYGSSKYKNPVFMFPGFEGRAKYVEELIRNLKRTVYCFQYPFEKTPSNVATVVDDLYPIMDEYARKLQNVNIVAHSYGGLIAMKLISRLESQSKQNVRLCLIDSSPFAIKYMIEKTYGSICERNEFENTMLFKFLNWMKLDNVEQFYEAIEKCENWETKLNMVLDNVPDHPEFNKINIRIVLQAIYRVSEAIQLYDDNFGKLTTKTTLVRPTVKVLPLPDDFQIQKHFTQPVTTLFTEGTHFNMLKFEKTADLINEGLEI